MSEGPFLVRVRPVNLGFPLHRSAPIGTVPHLSLREQPGRKLPWPSTPFLEGSWRGNAWRIGTGKPTRCYSPMKDQPSALDLKQVRIVSSSRTSTADGQARVTGNFQ